MLARKRACWSACRLPKSRHKRNRAPQSDFGEILMAKCICLGSQPEHAMRFALLYKPGEWMEYLAEYGCCQERVSTFSLPCTRPKGHNGKCLFCADAGFGVAMAAYHKMG